MYQFRNRQAYQLKRHHLSFQISSTVKGIFVTFYEVLEILKNSDEYKDKISVSKLKGITVEGDAREIGEFVKAVREYGSYEAYLEVKRAEDAEKMLAESEIAKRYEAASEVFTTTGQSFDGYKITEYFGCISADVATFIGRKVTNIGSMTLSSKEELLANAGRIKTTTAIASTFSELREQALQELRIKASLNGCNAVIGASFSNSEMDDRGGSLINNLDVVGQILLVTATGTGVVIEEAE